MSIEVNLSEPFYHVDSSDETMLSGLGASVTLATKPSYLLTQELNLIMHLSQ